jgi:hypothetical protein
MGSISSRPDTAATKRDVDSKENHDKFTATKPKRVDDSGLNIYKFTYASEATTYDKLLLDGSISNADVRDDSLSGLHRIPYIGSMNKGVDTDILLYYLLTCDPPADVNGRDSIWGDTPMWYAAIYNNTSAVKVLIDFGGDRTIKTNRNDSYYSYMTPLDVAKEENNQENIKLLMECFPSEE